MDREHAGQNHRPRILFLICGALANEIIALTRQPRWKLPFEIMALPAILHNHPDQIVPRLEEKLGGLDLSSFSQIIIGYGDCGTGGGIEKLCQSLEARGVPVTCLPGAHCYAFFYGVPAFEALAQETPSLFYLTDFLAQHFENFVIRPLGLDRHPELLSVYFQHYTGVCYLAQAPTPALYTAAEKAAAFLNLPLHVIETGYGDLERVFDTLQKDQQKPPHSPTRSFEQED